MIHENSSTNILLKTLILKYFAIENDGCKLDELYGTLIMRNNFVRKLRSFLDILIGKRHKVSNILFNEL